MSDDAMPGPDAPALPREPNPTRPGTGIRPAGFVAVASATAEAATEAMDRLRRAGIVAHLEPARPPGDATSTAGVLYVDTSDMHDARTVLATMDDGIGPAAGLGASHRSDRPHIDADGADTQHAGTQYTGTQYTDTQYTDTQYADTQSIDDAFAALVSHLDIDTTWTTGPGPGGSNGRTGTLPGPQPPVADGSADGDDATSARPDDNRTNDGAADAVSRRLRDEQYVDPPELREEHYEPPAPPPIPRPGPLALIGIAVILFGIAVLGFGTSLGVAPDRTLPTGIILVLAGSAMLVARLKHHRDDEDDGAVL